MVYQVRLTQSQLRKIQKSFKLKRQTIVAKVEVLQLQWNKLLSKMTEVSANIGDSSISDMLTKIYHVPKAIQMEALLKFVEQC